MKVNLITLLFAITFGISSCKKCWRCTYPYPDKAMGGGVFEVCDKEYMKKIDGNIRTDAQGKNPKEVKCKPFFK